ncbi:aminoacyl-tRNA deacylase [Candidimonas sp. SYP-B2681]|uniref:aminoacyl-tRNA deacylase n=1 Tax=Candidimonas sp. SYP-B2681 TaxID=2497686 RepID=UPI000F89148B|nr:aminoacyl-tRNA deacylase [Candidimonas sp. SYP-B2681]RTZ44698.1 aminoacyl-tRNA deacylase [Candidimonas sp. SYP-B2681]
MAKEKHVSETPATQFLKKHQIAYSEHPYDYVDHGGATVAANRLGLDLHQVAKTLIMEDEKSHPLVMVMHGDCEVSTKNLARQIGVKSVSPCTPDNAQKHSGYLVGGTSPFATRKKMPVWIEAGLLAYSVIYVNGGKRGYLIGVPARTLADPLGAKTVNVALPKS